MLTRILPPTVQFRTTIRPTSLDDKTLNPLPTSALRNGIGKSLQTHMPPALKRSSATHPNPGTAAAAIRGQLDEAERQARINREVLHDLANSIDDFVSSQDTPAKRQRAHGICGRFIHFVSLEGYAESNGNDYITVRVRSQPATSTSTSTKAVSWADIVKTRKIQG